MKFTEKKVLREVVKFAKKEFLYILYS